MRQIGFLKTQTYPAAVPRYFAGIQHWSVCHFSNEAVADTGANSSGGWGLLFYRTGLKSQETSIYHHWLMHRKFCCWEQYLLSVSTILFYSLKHDFTELSTRTAFKLSYTCLHCDKQLHRSEIPAHYYFFPFHFLLRRKYFFYVGYV